MARKITQLPTIDQVDLTSSDFVIIHDSESDQARKGTIGTMRTHFSSNNDYYSLNPVSSEPSQNTDGTIAYSDGTGSGFDGRSGEGLYIRTGGEWEALRPLRSDEAIINTFLEAANSYVDPSVKIIRVLGYANTGDGGWAFYTEAANSTPGHVATFTTDDGRTWELSPDYFQHNPKQFGAKFDNSTDDTDAINNAADYCRLYKVPLYLNSGNTVCSNTIYLGQMDVIGRGNSRFSNPSWSTRSVTLIKGAGQPAVAKCVPGEEKASGGIWRDFEIKGVGSSFANTNTIDLWFKEDYEYQIGVWLGRSFEFLSSGSAIEDGAAFGYIQNVTIRDVSGWAIYGHYTWGLSHLDEVTIHSCGGEASVGYDDDTLGGAICFDNTGVDWRMSNIHSIHWSYGDESPYTRRGTFIRLGSPKNITDALGRSFESGGNVCLDNLQCESAHYTLYIVAGNDVKIDGAKLEGPMMQLGSIYNPDGQARIAFGRWSAGNNPNDFVNTLDAIGSSNTLSWNQVGMNIYIEQAEDVDLGTYIHSREGVPTTIIYKGGVKLTTNGTKDKRRNKFRRRFPIIFVPDFDASESPSGTSGWVPFMDCDSHHLIASEADNILPVYGNSAPEAPFSFEGDGAVAQFVNETSVRIAKGGSGTYREILASNVAVDAGELYSFAFRGQLYGTQYVPYEVEFGVYGNEFEDFSRRLSGSGAGTVKMSGTGTGLVTVANNDTIVYGNASADFETAFDDGGGFITIDGGKYRIKWVEDARTLHLAHPFRGADQTDVSWTFLSEDNRFSRVVNFIAPHDGVVNLYVRSYSLNSVFINDFTLVKGLLIDFKEV